VFEKGIMFIVGITRVFLKSLSEHIGSIFGKIFYKNKTTQFILKLFYSILNINDGG